MARMPKKLDQHQYESFVPLDSDNKSGRIVVNADGSTIGASPQNIKITKSGSYTYVAKAPVGTAQASAAWQAFRMDKTSGLVILYADGNANFDNVATDLTALTYS